MKLELASGVAGKVVTVRAVMSYEIDCSRSRFRVDDPDAALARLKQANRSRALFDLDDVPELIEDAESLQAALEACGWEVELQGEDIDRLFGDASDYPPSVGNENAKSGG